MRKALITRAVAVVGTALAIMIASGQEKTPASDDLNAEIASLRSALDALDSQFQRLQAGEQAPASPQGEIRINMALVRRIKLPAAPTRETIREYVAELLEACSDQNNFTDRDAALQMLTAIGPENLDILLDEMKKKTRSPYVQWAVERLLLDEDKDLIIEALQENPQVFMPIIAKRRWQADVRDMLVAELHRRPKFLSVDLVTAVAQLEDPSTCDDLMWHLQNGPNVVHTCRAIMNLPGINKDDVVAITWSRIRAEWEKKAMAEFAVACGQLDALEYMINSLGPETASPQGLQNARRIALDALPEAGGTDDQIKQWFASNKDRLVFDPATRTFKLKREAKQ